MKLKQKHREMLDYVDFKVNMAKEVIKVCPNIRDLSKFDLVREFPCPSCYGKGKICVQEENSGKDHYTYTNTDTDTDCKRCGMSGIVTKEEFHKK